MPTDELVLWLMRCAMLCLAILTNCAWPASAERPPRVFFIGLDGTTWTVMRPLLEQGRLPNIKSLIDRGSSGVLHSIPPMHSPSPVGEDMPGHIWTVIVQSKYLKAHPPSLGYLQ